MICESYSAEDTRKLGYNMGRAAQPGTVICLDGDLGTGKTVFTAGFAEGLGIDTAICSPTFTILQVYDEGRLPMYHFDGLIREILPEGTVFITISKDVDRGFDYRKISIEGAEVVSA